MLPFLKHKKEAGIAEPVTKYIGEVPALVKCADKLIECINKKDASGVAEALKVAFQELEKEPHEEGPHTEESSEEPYEE